MVRNLVLFILKLLKDHSSGDHTSFTGMSWPCIQVNLGTTSDEDTEMLSTTSAAAHSTTLRDNASNPYDWTDFQYNTEPIYADGTNFADYYQEGGDFYGENCDRRLDDVSHTAVYDDTDEIERSVDDFQDDFDCDLMSNLSTSLPVYTSEIPTAVPSPYEAAVQEETGWYQSSYGEEFMNDIKFLEDFWRIDRPLLRYAMIDDWNQKLEDAWRDSLIKRKLNRSSSNIGNRRLSLAMTDEQLDDHETLSLIIDTIKIPSQINEGIRMLHEFHLCRPQLDLRPYVEEFDFYKKRFIIWGLNYYFNVDEQKRKNN
uniref:Uncharacterized protein n=1 Tax=Rhodnius prolixus TaxID=13249 RepID=T1I1Z3_RHOPR